MEQSTPAFHVSLNQVTLLVKDFDTNKTFFQKLGFQLIVDSPPHYARFQLSNGATFSLDLDKDVDVRSQHKAQLFFELPSREELDHYCAHLLSIGVAFKEMPTERDYLWCEARLETPENHDVRVYFAGENRLNPPWRI